MSSLPQKAPGGGPGGVPLQQQPQPQSLHMGAGSLASVPGQASMPPNPAALREISPVFLCRIGQDTVQDIVTRTMEIFQITRATQVDCSLTYVSIPRAIYIPDFRQFFLWKPDCHTHRSSPNTGISGDLVDKGRDL